MRVGWGVVMFSKVDDRLVDDRGKKFCLVVLKIRIKGQLASSGCAAIVTFSPLINVYLMAREPLIAVVLKKQ
jgi:hypothetical protein